VSLLWLTTLLECAQTASGYTHIRQSVSYSAQVQALIEAVPQLPVHQNVDQGLLYLFPTEQKTYPQANLSRN